MRRLVKFLFSILKLALVAVLVVVGFAVWQQYSGGYTPPPAVPQPPPYQPPNPSPPAGAYPAPSNLPVVDLVVLGARANWQHGQRYFEVTVRNQGPEMAPVVHADCSYRCASSGESVNSNQLFRNAQLWPGQSLNTLLQVIPCADAGFQLSCIAYSGVRVQEGNTGNNQWTGWVQFR